MFIVMEVLFCLWLVNQNETASSNSHSFLSDFTCYKTTVMVPTNYRKSLHVTRKLANTIRMWWSSVSCNNFSRRVCGWLSENT